MIADAAEVVLRRVDLVNALQLAELSTDRLTRQSRRVGQSELRGPPPPARLVLDSVGTGDAAAELDRRENEGTIRADSAHQFRAHEEERTIG
ncbi:hypothetical protein L1080_023360 [Rhodococcus sp. MSC1_016]|uniref:hypothetical protein n=1 Tax=Rhodococcus sp. MSC1_016 TaxID=2909266 RepID=UPI00202DC187|nr:hypothetical protein [Rhodococcus sp. MSC1_016]